MRRATLKRQTRELKRDCPGLRCNAIVGPRSAHQADDSMAMRLCGPGNEDEAARAAEGSWREGAARTAW